MYEMAEYLIRGCLLGVTYGLLACPMSMVFATTGALDVAIGAYAVLAGAIAYSQPGWIGVTLALLSAVLAATALGYYANALTKRFRDDHIVVILGIFGFTVALESFILTVFGEDPYYQSSFTDTWAFAGIYVAPQLLLNAIIGLFIALGVYLLIYRSPLGRAMRAGASNPTGATLSGMPVRRIQLATFVIGGLLAGVAGVLIVHSTGLIYSQALPLTVTSFGAALLFGLTRPLYAFLGGVVIGVVESLSVGFAPNELASILPLFFIFAVIATGRASREETVGGRA